MTAIEVPSHLPDLDAALAALPNAPAVFAIWPREGEPYLSRTALLRRRLLRLLGERERPGRFLNLRGAAARVEYRLTASSLESAAVLYEQARRLFPRTYLEALRLRMPPYVHVALSNRFPRSHVTARLGRAGGMYFGPFRSRTSAERFEGGFLDLFQMRRCQEEIVPSPEHPGCIYGEMGMCVRPCQQVVGPAEYGQEVARAVEFLHTDGLSLLDAISRSRDRLSEEMQFEEAARQHKRFAKIQETLKLRDELARDADRFHGVAITRSLGVAAVDLWPFRGGNWQPRLRFDYQVEEGRPVSLDRKLRDALSAATPQALGVRERQERLAILARWYYSTWRDGEWVAFDDWERIPYRKLVHAISRVAAGGGAAGSKSDDQSP